MNLFNNADLGSFLTGHLVLDSILVLMLETSPEETD